ncbi:MAG: hypothetical protein KC503_01510, partial [Myxococcales bacterium]|nr:hypothetical protein [Myxococcales bacterium]
WDEIASAGPLDVGFPAGGSPLRAAALQIARELMDRVAHNLRELNVRLVASGIAFSWLDPIEAADADAPQRIAELEQIVGPLPPALVAWYERFYHVHLQGCYDGWVESLARKPGARQVPREDHCFGDPLSVSSIDQLLAAARTLREDAATPPASFDAPWTLPLGPDMAAKEGLARNQYKLLLPGAGADAQVVTHRRCGFVEHLRECIALCGFYGFGELERRPAVVDRVAAHLLPF